MPTLPHAHSPTYTIPVLVLLSGSSPESLYVHGSADCLANRGSHRHAMEPGYDCGKVVLALLYANTCAHQQDMRTSNKCPCLLFSQETGCLWWGRKAQSLEWGGWADMRKKNIYQRNTVGTHIQAHTPTPTDIRAHSHTRTHTHTHMHACTHSHSYSHTHARTHTHTRIH